MLRVYHSNDLEMLKGALIRQIENDPLDFFDKEVILVQSQGMSHWLKLQLADGLGISAQVDFPLPSNFIWRVFNLLQPDLPERSHFDKAIMAWKLYRLLPELAKTPECEAIANYLTQENNPVKCYQLAHNIADVFDQYLVYRPDWLLEWEQGSNNVEGQELGAQSWQPVVWRALIKDSEQLQHSLEHRAQLIQKLPELIKQHKDRLQSLPKRLFVFGIAALPGAYWQVLEAISNVIDVHYFLLNPCQNFWGDLLNDRQRLKILSKAPDTEHIMDRGNPLLASWGKLGKDFLTLINESATDHLHEVELFYQAPKQRPRLLAYLKNDILELHDRQQNAFTAQALIDSQFKQAISSDDTSISFVDAHSPLREVQQLYDQILYWLDQDPNLKPRDIVVMVPDINQYAPYIDAVFSSHNARFIQPDNTEARYQIPWAISDQAIAAEDPIVESFLQLLNLPDSRFTLPEVFDLLDVPAIRHRFDIKVDELEQIKNWLLDAQIRFGLDGEQRSQQGMPSFEQNSWHKGLKQLLLGYALPNTDQDFMQDYPVFAVEGNEGELLGKIMAFIDQLSAWQKRLNQSLIKEDWQQQLTAIIDQFYLPDDNEISSLQGIRQSIQQWVEDTDLSALTDSLPIKVLAIWFNEHLGTQTGWQRFLAGPVNFCTLMPMRSIPFKAVCLLGMNDSDYPRRVTPLGFDLMQSKPSRLGDRSRREDDRYLFLEAVSSAQDYLYISYRGRSARDNAEQQPSVLVAELRDYLADGFCLDSDLQLTHSKSRERFLKWLVDELPLQPYNADRFVEHKHKVPGYQHLWMEVAQAGLSEEKTDLSWQSSALALPADLNTDQVNVQDMVLALSDPCKFFIRRRLQSSLDIDWQEKLSAEPFATEGLEQYQLKSQWLDSVQHQPSALDDIETFNREFISQQQALGNLPVKELGKHSGLQVAKYTESLVQAVQPLMRSPLGNTSLSVNVNGTEVLGELQQAFSALSTDHNYFLYYQVSSLKGKHLLNAWLKLLVAVAADAPVQSAYLFALSKDEVQQIKLSAPSKEVALEQIAIALEWYWQCWHKPIPHLPNTLHKLFNKRNELEEKAKSEQDLMDQMVKYVGTLLKEEYDELASDYLKRCLPTFNESFESDYQEWLEEWGALMQGMAGYMEIIKEDN